MRIVHVIPALGPGGAEQVLSDLAKWQIERGHDVRILVASQSETGGTMVPDFGDRCVVIGGSAGIWAYPMAARWVMQHRESLLASDIFHAHLIYGSFVGSLIDLVRCIGQRGRPLVLETDHSAGMPISPAQRWAFSVSRWQRRAMVSVIRGSSSTRVRSKAQAWEIPNSIAPLPLRSSWTSHAPFSIGSLGLLRPDRRPDIYLDLLKLIAQKRDVRFTYGGDGPYRSQLEDAIRRSGLGDRVSIGGLVTRKSDFFQELDLHVSLAVGKDVGLASLESASSGTPSVAIQLLRSHTGERDPIPSSADLKSLSDLVVSLIDSRRQRESLGRKQADYVRTHRSIESMGAAYEDVYLHLLGLK